MCEKSIRSIEHQIGNRKRGRIQPQGGGLTLIVQARGVINVLAALEEPMGNATAPPSKIAGGISAMDAKSLEAQIASLPPSKRTDETKIDKIVESLHDVTPRQRREAAKGISQQLRLGNTISSTTHAVAEGSRLTVEVAPQANVQALKKSLAHLAIKSPSLVDSHTLELRLKPKLDADSAVSQITKDPRVTRAYISPHGVLE
jgi:hypothetical protein